ncbi:MAG: helix-turn-helix transcriptional regulator [Oscillospiraceae bacterium]|nr:helix-turn-helix transcriptional regulator [Oscillospiraceae bacterium]
MEFPIFSVVRCGRFHVGNNSTRRLIDPTDELGTHAVHYELEFYYADCPGGLTIGSISHTARRGFFSCCKPGQYRKMVLPYKCFFINIATKDPALIKALDALPDYAPMEQTEQILSLCKTIAGESSRDALHGKLLIEGCVCTILSILLRNSCAIANYTDHKVDRHQSCLLAANHYLREHLQENISLETLAHDSGLHPTYFHKLFTAAFGKTPTQQLTSYRIHAAVNLLMNDELPISEISSRCGFSTPNYFCSKFREETGISPREYRKTCREKWNKKK